VSSTNVRFSRYWLFAGLLIAAPSWGQNAVNLTCPSQATAGSNVLCTLALSLGMGVNMDSLTFAVVVTPNGAAPAVPSEWFSPSIGGAFLSNGGTNNSISAVWASPTLAFAGGGTLGVVGFTVPASAVSSQTYSATIVGGSAALGNNIVNLSIGAATVWIARPELNLNPTSLSFTAVQGSVNPANQTVAVSSSGMVNWTASVTSGSFLSLSGATSGSNLGTITAAVNTSDLTAGTYNDNIQVILPGASNTPQEIPVTLVVSPPASILLSPNSLSFNAVQGGANPTNQTTYVSNSGSGTLNWSASVVSGSFLSLTGATSGANSGAITAAINIGGLTAGTYNGTIQVIASGATTSNISVTLGIEDPTQFAQQGAKLVGSGVSGIAAQGRSVALSSDGGKAIVGGFDDNNAIGAAWTFARIGGIWNQGGSKLVGTGATQGFVSQGISAAVSADGKTALIGGNQDHNNLGAAWVYVQTGGVWIQQGDKLVGTNAVSSAFQGRSVALSADGNTGIVGGNGDSNFAGAAWVFTRDLGVWTQQGGKLLGTGAVGSAEQGTSVALSSDGSTAIVGGPSDNNGAGAAWVFSQVGDVWTQQGAKLVGTANVGNAQQGSSVALSGDGSTAIIGGWNDNGGTGAAWVFTRVGGMWTQGAKLVGMGAVGNASQGSSVSLSGDGNTAVVGGYRDNNSAGAAWIFIRRGIEWLQGGSKLVGTGAIGAAQQGLAVALSADGSTALLGGWQDNSSAGAAWVFTNPNAAVPNACDINGDGSVTVSDVQLEINEVLGVSPAVNDLNHDGRVTVADVQIVINAVLGLGCPF
jgi:hypothetical protein